MCAATASFSTTPKPTQNLADRGGTAWQAVPEAKVIQCDKSFASRCCFV
jgi:hypothetical protein